MKLVRFSARVSNSATFESALTMCQNGFECKVPIMDIDEIDNYFTKDS